MKIIKNEKGIFMKLPRENIEFYGDTPEEKKVNEVIYDLSLENDSLYQQIDQLTNNWNKLEEWLKSYIALIENPDTLEEQTLEDLKEVLYKIKEIKEGNNVSGRD